MHIFIWIRMIFMTGKKGQGAIEYLLIIGAAILVVAIVIIAIVFVTSSGGDFVEREAEGGYLDPLEQARIDRLEGATSCWNASLNPIPICSSSDLNRVKYYPEKNFVLKNNINAGATTYWDNGKGFFPIGGGCLEPKATSKAVCEREKGCQSTWKDGTSGYCTVIWKIFHQKRRIQPDRRKHPGDDSRLQRPFEKAVPGFDWIPCHPHHNGPE